MNEYKDLINKDTKFMMRDEDGIETEMTTSEVINQLYQDNKALEHYINNLQSKIDKAIEYIEENGYNVSNNILLDILKENK